MIIFQVERQNFAKEFIKKIFIYEKVKKLKKDSQLFYKVIMLALLSVFAPSCSYNFFGLL
jgi:hypothetical protein